MEGLERIQRSLDSSATARGSSVRYSKFQKNLNHQSKQSNSGKDKSIAIYRKKLRCTYIKPDEEQRLKKLAIKKQSSRPRLNVTQSTPSLVVKPQASFVPTVGLHLRMQMMSSEDQPGLLQHARTSLSHELKLLLIHHADLIENNENLRKERDELEKMRVKLRSSKCQLKEWRKMD